MKVEILYDERMSWHQNGVGHPERPERVQSLVRMIQEADYSDQIEFPDVQPITRDLAELVHTRAHLDQLENSEASPVTFFDADTQSNEHSYQAARLAAGAVVAAVKRATEDTAIRPFAVVRPPGHHAEADRAMGFCFINSVAVAAAYALAELSYSRVAVVDWDVHHGNGTQHIFYDRDDVFYVSLHQSPHYPGTGSAAERGRGSGEGTTLNVPMPAGSDGADYLRAIDDRVVPELDKYQPELILVSAGFDTHADDPLASMQLYGKDYVEITRRLLSLADRHASGRIVHVLEGGYDLDALGEGADAVIRCLLET